MLPRFREVDSVIGPYHQRTVFEVHPELGFHQINEDEPLQHPKHTLKGIAERRSILEKRMPGCDRLFESVPEGASIEVVLDATADLWTARRIAARAIQRLPEDPVWDDSRAADGAAAIAARMLRGQRVQRGGETDVEVVLLAQHRVHAEPLGLGAHRR